MPAVFVWEKPATWGGKVRPAVLHRGVLKFIESGHPTIVQSHILTPHEATLPISELAARYPYKEAFDGK